MGLKVFHCINILVCFLCLWRYTAENCAKSRLKITALQIPDQMKTMIVDLRNIYSTGPLLNVVYCGWMYALDLKSAPLNMENQSQIIHYSHDIWHWCCHVSILFLYSKKEKLRMSWYHFTNNTSIWFLFSLVCHQSCMHVALGYIVPLNSHYEFR